MLEIVRIAALSPELGCRVVAETLNRQFAERCVVNSRSFIALVMHRYHYEIAHRLQRIRPHCLWQNGRIERFFGTLKQRLDRIAITDGDDLLTKLAEFRCWYNHARPHQHLSGRPPAKVWAGREEALGTPTRFCAWDGRLVGCLFPL